MSHPFAVIVLAVLVWWLSTGLVLMAVRRAENVPGTAPVRAVLGWMTVAGLAGLGMLIAAADMMTPAGSLLGFFGALLVWSWHEAAFLTGALTGPARGECPPGLSGWSRFLAAWRAVSHHEVAILATVVVLFLLLRDGPNHFGLATFMVLWVMRISAKLVIFLGAPNAVSDLMPRRIAHLKSHFRTSGITPFFPLAIALAAGLFIVLCAGAANAVLPYSVTGHVLLASFVALAILEHFILVLPVSDATLWRWAIPADRKTSTQNDRTKRAEGAPANAETIG